MAEEWAPAVAALLDDLRPHYTMPLIVRVSGSASGTLSPAQTAQVLQPNGTLAVVVRDQTAVDYSLSRELLRMKLATDGFSPLQFHLTTGDAGLDEQHLAVATAAYNAVAQGLIRAWQDAHGLVTPPVLAALMRGVTSRLTAAGAPEQRVFRLLTLLEALVLFEGGSAAQQAEWAAIDAMALSCARELVAPLEQADVGNPFGFRRAVVKLWRQLDATLVQLGYAPTENAEFATLPPVLSARQLRLQVSQTYTLKHSEWVDRTTGARGYVALGKSDTQNAFVLPVPTLSPDEFQALYRRALGDVLTDYHLDYTIREGTANV